MAMTARALYGAMIQLHPRAFREAFARDMLCVFDDAVESHGGYWLLRDVALSLMRQRLLRSQAGVAKTAEGQFCLMAGIYPNIRAPHLTPAKLTGALFLTLLTFFLYPPPSSVQHPWERHTRPLRVEARYGNVEVR